MGIKPRALTASERQYVASFFNHTTIEQAQIIDGYVPFWLRRSMIAVVLGKRIFFRQGVYQPNTAHGIHLLAHELTHVEQFLSGMTIWSYLWASRQGYKQNKYEVQACQQAEKVSLSLTQHENFTISLN